MFFIVPDKVPDKATFRILRALQSLFDQRCRSHLYRGANPSTTNQRRQVLNGPRSISIYCLQTSATFSCRDGDSDDTAWLPKHIGKLCGS